MKKNSLLAFIAALLFAVAAIISAVNGTTFRAVISGIAALSFILAGIHWGKKDNKIR
jgi:hypothetical protein